MNFFPGPSWPEYPKDSLGTHVRTITHHGAADLDYDGNWRDTDSDGDGYLDYDEWIDNWDPYDPNSHP